ncbi:response regulator [Microvirga sp. 0TCS3.31]
MPEASFILVVEDDAFVRAVAVDALEEDGFKVLEAPSADYAATLLETRQDIGLLFTDVSMPGMLNGFDLARRAQALHPDIAVLVTSGALPSGFSGEALQTRFVPKPYRMSEVIQIIRGMAAQSFLCVFGVATHASWYLNLVY